MILMLTLTTIKIECMKRVIKIILLLISSLNCFAQLEQFGISKYSFVQPDPEAFSFTKYGSIPNNHYVGLPSISIPIHELTFEELKIPINLTYQQNGFSVQEEASIVGLGWNLSSTAVINRDVRDGDDLNFLNVYGAAPVGWVYQPNLENTYIGLNEQTLWEIAQYGGDDLIKPDVEPDIFMVSLFGESFKFVLEKWQSGDFLIGKAIDTKDFRISLSRTTLDFKIIDDRGYSYTFSKKSYSKTSLTQYSTLTSWYLTSIIAPNSKSITFSYTPSIKVRTQEVLSQTSAIPMCFFSLSTDFANPLAPVDQSISNSEVYNEVDTHYLEAIYNGREHLLFYYSDRNDIICISPLKKAKKLDKIEIKHARSAQEKDLTNTISFVTSYFNNENLNSINKEEYLRLKLDKVLINDQLFTMDYSSISSLPSKKSKSIDFWGFFNGKNNSVLFPTYLNIQKECRRLICDPCYNQFYNMVYNFTDGADRDADSNFSKLGMMSRLTYPTGGYTEFVYEGNTVKLRQNQIRIWDISPQYLYDTSPYVNKEVGGLRIKTIKDYDYNSVLLNHREFFYLESEGTFSSGKLMDWIVNYREQEQYENDESEPDIVGKIASRDSWGTYAIRSSSNINPMRNSAAGYHIGYSRVEERFIGNNNSYKTVLNFSNTPNIPMGFNNRPLPANINPRHGWWRKNINNANFGGEPVKYDHKNGKIISKQEYNDIGELISTSEFEYETLNDGEFKGTKLQQGVVFGYARYVDSWQTYSIPIRKDVLKKQINKSFKGAEILIETLEYSTDNKWKTKTIESFGSNNKRTRTKFYYTYDYSILSDLESKNILSPVKFEKSINDFQIDGAIIEYNNEGNPIRQYNFNSSKPVILAQHNPDSLLQKNYVKEIDIEYSPLTKRVTRTLSSTGIPTIYIWGYDNKILLASIQGIEFSELSLQCPNIDYVLLDNPTSHNQLENELLRIIDSLKNYKSHLGNYNSVFPLIGTKIKFNSNGVLRKYEYDSFYRLKLIRDSRNSILSFNQYYFNK